MSPVLHYLVSRLLTAGYTWKRHRQLNYLFHMPLPFQIMLIRFFMKVSFAPGRVASCTRQVLRLASEAGRILARRRDGCAMPASFGLVAGCYQTRDEVYPDGYPPGGMRHLLSYCVKENSTPQDLPGSLRLTGGVPTP